MTDLSQLSDEEANVRLAILRGIEPRKMWRFWYDAERQHGAIMIRSKRDAEESRQREIATQKRLFNEDITPSEPEEYDDYNHAPRYCSSLDECAKVEAGLTDEQRHEYFERYLPAFSGAQTRDQGPLDFALFAGATARQRAEALIATLQP